jgi:tetratricopeptide (TPR) repeat protein
MKVLHAFHNHILAALVLLFAGCLPATAQTAKLDDLFAQLLTTDEEGAKDIEAEIWIEWSKSGSPAMDLLLERGRQAMAEGYPDIAIEHFTALIDHAPEFAEGWNARATAYYNTGDFGPSIADIGHVLTLNPRHFGAMAGLAAIFEELDRPEQALEVYRAALAIHPQQPDVLDAIKRLESDLKGQDL